MMVTPPSPVKVLLVDDDPFVRELLGCIFRLEGCGVAEAASGEDAMVLLMNDPKIRIVMSDLQMPRGDGFWLIRQIEQLDLPIPIIVMTGDRSIRADDVRLVRAKMLFYKPFLETYEEMVTSIRAILKQAS